MNGSHWDLRRGRPILGFVPALFPAGRSSPRRQPLWGGSREGCCATFQTIHPPDPLRPPGVGSRQLEGLNPGRKEKR
jgi:hypothetical protein